MEILKNMSEEELDSLRATFENNPRRALSPPTFRRTLMRISESKVELAGRITKSYLRHLFADIDTAATGYVSWTDFTMFAIDQARRTRMDGVATAAARTARWRRSRQRASMAAARARAALEEDSLPSHGPPTFRADSPCSSSSSVRSSSEESNGEAPVQSEDARDSAQDRRPRRSERPPAGRSGSDGEGTDSEGGDAGSPVEEHAAFREFHVDHMVPQPHGSTLQDIRVLPRARKVVQLTLEGRGLSALTVFNLEGQRLLPFGKLPRQAEVVTAWDYVPPSVGVQHGNALACAFNGGLVQLHTLEKKIGSEELLRPTVSLRLSETQTAVQWAAGCNRLILGSRGGFVSTWNVDAREAADRVRLHTSRITAMTVRGGGGLLLSASLDRSNSVKGMDLERGVVRFSFSDHDIGGVTCLESDDEFFFTAGLEPRIVQRGLQGQRLHPTYLYDATQPHTGRISQLYRLPHAPVLVSGDTQGTVKVWDLRMGMCLQTMTAPVLTSVKHRAVSPARGLEGEVSSGGGGGGGCSGDEESGGGGGGSRLRDVGTSSTRVSAADRAVGGVSTICLLPTSNHVLVGTPRQLISLSNDTTTCPELADDASPCRFVLFPDPDSILTVHERGVKLWQLATGCVVYASDNDLLEGDIAACACVEPLRRQFLLGSMEGELASFSVALARRTASFTPALRASGAVRAGEAIVALETIPGLRGSAHPYAVVVTAQTAVLVPIAPQTECRPTSILSLATLRVALEGAAALVRDAALHDGRLYLVTTASTMVEVDLQQPGAAAVTLQPPAVAGSFDSIAVGRVLVGAGAGAVGGPALAATLLFAPDGGGRVCVGGAVGLVACPSAAAAPPHPQPIAMTPARPTTPAPATRLGAHQWLGYWPPASAARRVTDAATTSLATTSAQTLREGGRVSWRWLPRSDREAAGPGADDEAVSHEGSESRRRRGREPSRGECLTHTAVPAPLAALTWRAGDRRGAASVVVTHVYCFSAEALVATGDEKGGVQVWDMWAIAAAVAAGGPPVPPPPSLAACPVLVASWTAHTGGFTAFGGCGCPRTGLPLVLTAGVDRMVWLWSATGVALGSLATGRSPPHLQPTTVSADTVSAEVGESAGGNSHNQARGELAPYLLSAAPTRTALREYWSSMFTVLAARATAVVDRTPRLGTSADSAREPAAEPFFVTDTLLERTVRPGEAAAAGCAGPEAPLVHVDVSASSTASTPCAPGELSGTDQPTGPAPRTASIAVAVTGDSAADAAVATPMDTVRPRGILKPAHMRGMAGSVSAAHPPRRAPAAASLARTGVVAGTVLPPMAGAMCTTNSMGRAGEQSVGMPERSRAASVQSMRQRARSRLPLTGAPVATPAGRSAARSRAPLSRSRQMVLPFI